MSLSTLEISSFNSRLWFVFYLVPQSNKLVVMWQYSICNNKHAGQQHYYCIKDSKSTGTICLSIVVRNFVPQWFTDDSPHSDYANPNLYNPRPTVATIAYDPINNNQDCKAWIVLRFIRRCRTWSRRATSDLYSLCLSCSSRLIVFTVLVLISLWACIIDINIWISD